MGILHSNSRFLGCKKEDEEDRKRPFYYQKWNLEPCNGGDFSRSSDKRILKILNFHRLIFKAIKGLLQKVHFIFCFSGSGTRAEPVLPAPNSAPTLSTIIDDASLVQPHIISYSSSEIGSLPDSENNVDAAYWESNSLDRNERDSVIISIDFADSENNVDAVSCESYSTNRKEIDYATISIPDFAGSGNNVDAVSFESNSTNGKEMDCTIISMPDFADSENDVDVVSYISNSTNRKEMDCVRISIPEYLRHSLACTSVSQDIVDSTVVTDQESMNMAQGLNSEEERVIIKSEMVVVVAEEEEEEYYTEGIRWIKHYSSHHRILLVGEGDFSFSACLAVAFGWASNITATSLDSEAFLEENYKNAMSNIQKLRSRGSKVMHGIDATKMADHPLLGYLEFDRIVYNFPFAGFFKELPRKNQLRLHRRLVSLFLKNAKEMTSENGEIHITHKTNDFHNEWNLESMASSHGLMLIEAVKFKRNDYPGYNTKCGFGGDNNFNCNPAETYKFRLKRRFY
ncbi:hypothetical protein CDL12_08015 [Handroanthus impetiginosus]|uniref:25S rRNA (uridine-N(3))-methyltransferase BMT5-like domain-containing protein n=1 Tax=Handroanthus impetiginosus TaxID=429701 RepID=A0A2G9HP50_9LAMI|nr:hypothetical protein CDL12_08015 [Handroanthus impetiginosus]